MGESERVTPRLRERIEDLFESSVPTEKDTLLKDTLWWFFFSFQNCNLHWSVTNQEFVQTGEREA